MGWTDKKTGKEYNELEISTKEWGKMTKKQRCDADEISYYSNITIEEMLRNLNEEGCKKIIHINFGLHETDVYFIGTTEKHQ